MILRYAMPVPWESDGAAPLLHMARAHDERNTEGDKGLLEREDWLSLAAESQNTLGLLLDARTHATSRSCQWGISFYGLNSRLGVGYERRSKILIELVNSEIVGFVKCKKRI